VRVRRPLLLLVISGALFARAAGADPVGGHFELTPFAGGTVFDGGARLDGQSAKDGYYLGARLGYQFLPVFSVEAAGGYTPTEEGGPPGMSASFSHLSINGVWLPWGQLHGGPFLFVGGGTSSLKASGGSGESHGGYEFGGGWRLWMTDALAVRLEARQVFHKETTSDGTEMRINHMVLGAGLVFALGGHPRDTDGDGVPDRKDLAPGTPKGATVDAQGRPKDSDGDGVLDGLDKCPNTPKGCTIDKNGCQTDADGDGVCDGLDKCPDTPKGATVDANGCPSDSDGDGVPDGIDQCPNTPKGATVDAKGCPSDDDNDGVPNGIDQCPNTPPGFKVNAQGCPVDVIDKENELMDTGMIRAQNVQFDEGKATLLPSSNNTLDVVGLVLKGWPDLKIEIGGHTDNKGNAKKNTKLSQDRADAVKSYLTLKYPELKPGNLTTKGYGSSKPLVPNTGEVNMAKNRRVEFVVLNKDALRKGTEQRRAPQSAPADTTKH
jgi:outer membrane protein OmpA-like peptidoglycan-associated protein